jgi:hypothetical protein
MSKSMFCVKPRGRGLDQQNACTACAESLRGERSGYGQHSRDEDANRDCQKEHDFEHSPRVVAGHIRPRLLHESSVPQRSA